MRLRCPQCGAVSLRHRGFRIRPVCPVCGIRTERGEGDYFLGSMLFNLILAETLFAVGILAMLIATWPDVPWDFLEIAAPLLMIAAPIALYPWSKTLWLAFDLAFRPMSDADRVARGREAEPAPAADRQARG